MHALSGIRTHERSRPEAVDLRVRLRPRGHWNKLTEEMASLNEGMLQVSSRGQLSSDSPAAMLLGRTPVARYKKSTARY
jgi:hypothetical protein